MCENIQYAKLECKTESHTDFTISYKIEFSDDQGNQSVT